ncbi:OmpA family protein [Seonamhaeicola sp. NFXS20]|uniref:OmpA family protein n=1 Tax=Seonamhaeicola sp. NFXS20 TaxID=2816959 RepID=UPI003B8E176A
MSKKTSCLLGILLTIILGTILYYFFCCSQCCDKNSHTQKQKQEPLVETSKTKKATKNAFSITDENGDLKLETANNFNFKTSEFSILQPVSSNVEENILKLKGYLIKNSLKDLEITGLYKSEEQNNSAYPNLGLARANAVKNYLVLHGVPSNQIDTFGKLNDDIVPDEANTYYGPIKFTMQTLDASDTSALKALEKSCDSIRTNPLVLHFKTGQAAINLTAEQRQKIANISHCVDKLGVKVQVVGHTDNSGDANNNVVLGKQRADFAKGYLVKNGILEQNIETSSKGPHEPIADNATEDGRAKNRRTVITIN